MGRHIFYVRPSILVGMVVALLTSLFLKPFGTTGHKVLQISKTTGARGARPGSFFARGGAAGVKLGRELGGFDARGGAWDGLGEVQTCGSPGGAGAGCNVSLGQ